MTNKKSAAEIDRENALAKSCKVCGCLPIGGHLFTCPNAGTDRIDAPDANPHTPLGLCDACRTELVDDLCPSCDPKRALAHFRAQEVDPCDWCEDCGVAGRTIADVGLCPECRVNRYTEELYRIGRSWKCCECGDEVPHSPLSTSYLCERCHAKGLDATRDTLAAMETEWVKWSRACGLPEESADELLLNPRLRKCQRQYVGRFIERWEAVERDDQPRED